MDHSRRSILASSFAGLATLAGCTAQSTEANSTTTTPPSEDVETVDESAYDLSTAQDLESWSEYDPNWSAPVDPPSLDVETETVMTGLEIPWDLTFAPNDDLFVSQRPGELLHYDAGVTESVVSPDDVAAGDAIGVDEEGGWWAAGGEGGMMGNAVHPAYPEVPLVYAFYTYEDGDEMLNKLVYYDLQTDGPEATTVIDGIPGETWHNGSRITFGPENYLWVSTGDAGAPELAQDTSSLAGKVLRMEPDGGVPEGNPNVGGDPRVYTYGHRNVQGLSFLPDGTPIANEHGPSGRDEVNVLRPGGNYGWASEEERGRSADTYPDTEYERPVVNTGPDSTWAPPGSVFYTGDDLSSWRNRFVVGGLRSQRLNIVTLYRTDERPSSAEGGQRFAADWMDDEYSAVHHTALENELGRIRHVEQGPDGELYALTSNRDGRADGFPVEGDDRIVRIKPT
jgi:glucose/arabinose dehydrogenase